MLDQHGQPKVTDFGLAKRTESASDLTATGQILGTPSYMPPEQADGRLADVGPASDVYSIGAMLYEMLTGKPPFTASSAIDVVMKVTEANPVPVRSVNGNVPVDLETICLKCLEKNPLRRYASADELARDLGRFLVHEPILARPVSRAQRVWSWSKRHPWSITALACTCILGLLAATYWLWTDNTYLRYQLANPDYVPEAGTRTKQLDVVADSIALPFMAMMGCYLTLMLQVNRRRRTGKPINQWLLRLGTPVVVIAIILAIYLATKSIEAHVWEGASVFREWSTIYMTVLFGGFFLIQSYREFDAAIFGTVWEPPSELTDDETHEVRELLLQGNKIAAIRQVRKWKSAGLAEARRVVERVQDQLHREFPDRVKSGTSSRRWTMLVIMLSGLAVGFIFAFGWHKSPLTWIVAALVATLTAAVIRYRSAASSKA